MCLQSTEETCHRPGFGLFLNDRSESTQLKHVKKWPPQKTHGTAPFVMKSRGNKCTVWQKTEMIERLNEITRSEVCLISAVIGRYEHPSRL